MGPYINLLCPPKVNGAGKEKAKNKGRFAPLSALELGPLKRVYSSGYTQADKAE